MIHQSEPEPEQIAEILARASRLRPKLAMVLGTGFQLGAEHFSIERSIPFSKLPGFPRPGVRGHSGHVLLGRVAGTPVLVLNGRVHYYEGIDMSLVILPVKVLAAYGITDLLVTNAAGGINPRFRAGDFMILSDHINLMGINPLRGTFSQAFVDLSHAYDHHLSNLLLRAGRFAGLKLRTGVYLAVSGPSYETAAEIRAFRRLGADAVGMSTVPEVIVARYFGLRVAGLSCITNLAAGMRETPLSHAEVLSTAARVKNSAAELVKQFARLYAA